ncbi:MAG: rod shape-determining protein MreC [Lachnospiraceae bacterium]|nr:rod shape-determining protein MreC [Lachnospiraceae bacterium]
MKKISRIFKSKSRHLFAALVFISLGLIFMGLSASRFTGPLHGAAETVVAPMARGINRLGTALMDASAGFQDVRKLSRENEELKEEIAEMTETINRLSQCEEELTRLEELYRLDKQYPEYTKVAAQVIAKDPGPWYSTFLIDKGTNDGLAKDMNVIANGGLVGIITDVGKTWASVQAIIDDRSNISAMVTGASGTMVVSGNLLSMEKGTIAFSELRDPEGVVVEGASVVTSNISTKYLTGLLIGHVAAVEDSSNHLTRYGTIVPVADFRNLREVLVLLDLKQTKENSE